jgi:hypothetical protein
VGMNELGKWDERDNDGLLLSFSMEEKMEKKWKKNGKKMEKKRMKKVEEKNGGEKKTFSPIFSKI